MGYLYFISLYQCEQWRLVEHFLGWAIKYISADIAVQFNAKHLKTQYYYLHHKMDSSLRKQDATVDEVRSQVSQERSHIEFLKDS